MNTFKKATKRITAVAASAALVSSAVFGASLSNYPANFVKSGEFDGQVVIGADADSAAATSVIADLKSEFSGNSEKVKITAKMVSSEGGDIVSALDDNEVLTFGDSALQVEELDEDSTDLLEDGDLDGEDYEQTLIAGTAAEFGHRLFDEVKGEDEAVTGLFYAKDATYATYTLTFDNPLDMSDDFKGESFEIMGNEFTVLTMAADKLTLVGGSNKVSLGEGETSTVSVDGVSYEVEVQSVSTDKVLVTINGESKSVDSDEVEDIAGVTVGITEIVDSSRDAVKGYATLVIGGQKVELGNSANDLEINDESFDDLDQYDAYDVSATWTGNQTITVAYKTDDEVLLKEGDSLMDTLFGAFTLSYDGTNDVDYSEFLIESTSSGVTFGDEDTPFKLFNGDVIPEEFELSTESEDGAPLLLGSQTERIFFKGSSLTLTEADEDNTALAGLSKSGQVVSFNISTAGTDVEGQKFFTLEEGDEEDMRLFEITSYADESDDNDDESRLTVKDLFQEKTVADDKDFTDLASDLKLSGALTVANDNIVSINFSALDDAVLYLENEVKMDFSLIETAGNVTFTYDYQELEADNKADYNGDTFTLEIAVASDRDDEVKLDVSGLSFDEVKDGSDYEVAVDDFGTKVIKETDKNNEVRIMVPDEEVVGMVSFNFGEAGASVKTMTVDADMADAKVEELEGEGYTVSTEKVAAESVEFDITAPVMASEVSGMEDMIVVGGPAVNSVAVSLLGEGVVGVEEGEAVVRYFADSNSVLVYGYDAAGTQAAANKLNAGGLTGDKVNVQ